MRRGETMMHGGRAVQLVAFGSDGVLVRYLTTGQHETVQAADLSEPTEPDNRYNTGLTPGRVPQ